MRATARGKQVRDRNVVPILESLTKEAAALNAPESAATVQILARVVELVNGQAEQLQDAAPASARRAATPRRARSASR